MEKVIKKELGTTWNDASYERCYHALKGKWSKHWKIQCANVTELVTPHEKDTILDIGCGTGKYVATFSHHVKEIVGLEIDTKVLKWANKYASEEGKQKHYSFMCIDNLHIAHQTNKKFNKIMMLDIIEHMTPKNVDIYFDEFKRLLKKGGSVFIYTPNKYYFWEMLRHDVGHINTYSMSGLIKQLENNGYTIIQNYYRYSHVPILNIIERCVPLTFFKRRLCIEAKL